MGLPPPTPTPQHRQQPDLHPPPELHPQAPSCPAFLPFGALPPDGRRPRLPSQRMESVADLGSARIFAPGLGDAKERVSAFPESLCPRVLQRAPSSGRWGLRWVRLHQRGSGLLLAIFHHPPRTPSCPGSDPGEAASGRWSPTSRTPCVLPWPWPSSSTLILGR